MTTTSPDTWPRDFKVLQSAARLLDEKRRAPDHDEITAETGLTKDEVLRALTRLSDGRLIDVTFTTDGGELPRPEWVNSISREGLERSAVWPTAETAAARIVTALEQIEADTADDDTRTRVRKILDGFAGPGKQIAIGVATAAITGQLPS